jgi:catechol 2,3-dioxygenase-like lactoylglutathione lyase family enzyme
MPRLFSYGTLQRDDVQRATFGRSLPGHADALPGFELTRVPIDDPARAAMAGLTHHANVQRTGRPGASVAGTVLDLTAAELAQADVYERSWSYEREAVTLASGVEAWAYAHVPRSTESIAGSAIARGRAVIAFSHINLRAPRPLLEALRAFYCDVAGFEVGPRPPFGGFGYWLYAGSDPLLHLSEGDADAPPATNAATTIDHVAFACTDRPAMERRLRTHGIEWQMKRVPASGIVQLFVRDPGGNRVELSFSEPAPPRDT